jgi:hypothetical protein
MVVASTSALRPRSTAPLGDHFWSRQSDEFSGTMRAGKHNGRHFEE